VAGEGLDALDIRTDLLKRRRRRAERLGETGSAAWSLEAEQQRDETASKRRHGEIGSATPRTPP